jgi:predicted O-methyltransferase YrrM
MSQDQWTAVDEYLTQLLVPHDHVLDGVLHDSEQAGLPPIHVAPNQGKLLMLFAQMIGAKSILEVGTLGGYSTVWLARALPSDGKLITLEIDPKHAQVAQDNFAKAHLAHQIELRLGSAVDSLQQLVNEAHAPFDMVFIDADKTNNLTYFQYALQLSHVGSLIIVDNVVRGGAVIEAHSHDKNVQGVRQLLDALSHDKRVSVTAVQTVGSKGYDGLAIARVIA